MKKVKLTIIVIISFYNSSIAQNLTKDVDKLYLKYKNSELVTVTNAKVTVDFTVSIKLNANEKPESLTLIGYTYNQSNWDVESIIIKLGNDKLKSGYKYSGSNDLDLLINGYMERISVNVYTKGTQYAKYGISIMKPTINNYNPYEQYQTESEIEIWKKKA